MARANLNNSPPFICPFQILVYKVEQTLLYGFMRNFFLSHKEMIPVPIAEPIRNSMSLFESYLKNRILAWKHAVQL
jgi:hypothetical protein